MVPDEPYIHVSVAQQRLQLLHRDDVLLEVSISTAANGVGEETGSECTPRGWHRVCACIGSHCQNNTVFVARRPNGEVYSSALAAEHLQRDWILTRILWLGGLEAGRNRGGEVDTFSRYIYIHGAPDEVEMGVPGSHGCIRMRNDELLELYDHVRVGTRVLIEESA